MRKLTEYIDIKSVFISRLDTVLFAEWSIIAPNLESPNILAIVAFLKFEMVIPYLYNLTCFLEIIVSLSLKLIQF